MTNDLATPSRHTLPEDLFAILIGTMLVSLGVVLYAEATLTTGSTAGLALLLQYGTGIPFGWLFFAINLPFYALALWRMGWPFAIKTFVCVGLVSVFSAQFPLWLDISGIEPLFAARSLNNLKTEQLQLGDLAVLQSGVHVLAFLGGKTWIQADPNLVNGGDMVFETTAPSSNGWFGQRVVICRWKSLQ